MSATVGGAVKALLEAAGLALPVFRDRAPAGQVLPYALVREGIATAPEPAGDFSDPARQAEVREQVQVDVVQAWKDGDGGRLERYGLPQAVIRVLHGATLQDVLGGRCYPARVIGSTRLGPGRDDDTNLVRDTLTVEVLRVTTTTTV